MSLPKYDWCTKPGWGWVGGSHVNKSGMLFGQFWINPLGRPIWVWLGFSSTPIRNHLKRNRLNYQQLFREGIRASRPDSRDRRKFSFGVSPPPPAMRGPKSVGRFATNFSNAFCVHRWTLYKTCWTRSPCRTSTPASSDYQKTGNDTAKVLKALSWLRKLLFVSELVNL